MGRKWYDKDSSVNSNYTVKESSRGTGCQSYTVYSKDGEDLPPFAFDTIREAEDYIERNFGKSEKEEQ